jgi:hypothetical protein
MEEALKEAWATIPVSFFEDLVETYGKEGSGVY